ncbi:MAG TPA: PD-(D/E)XK nuclease family protein, partial [Chloroflexota bacterium]|nr:PD-(D/E)XK nuclease family protein [Chloroflexota bacterium]
RPRQIARERQDFLVALAAADGGRLTLTAPDSYDERAAIPSRWLLEVAGATSGRVVDATEFRGLSETGRPWLRVISSAQEAIERTITPADLEDRRLGEAARWSAAGRPFAQFPIARRAGGPLARAIAQRRAQTTSSLTCFDGNVSGSALVARNATLRTGAGRAMSASALQTWAVCGYRYFLERLVGVEPTERPEESPTIDAREGGTLVHAILQKFFDELAAVGRPGETESYGPDDVARIEWIAATEFAELVRRGVVGHPLVWENARGSILAVLRSFLTLDSRLRMAARVRPSRFEQGFGTGRRQSTDWPALEIVVDSVSLRFQGKIDRIDLDSTGSHAIVFDYKTGRVGSYQAVATDPVAAGQHLQLALYNQAVRANMPLITDVEARFWFITTKGQFKQVVLNDDADVVDARLAEVLRIITTGIRSGAFPQVPGLYTHGRFDNCGFCSFDRICPARRDRQAREKANDPLVALHTSLGTVVGPEAEE